MLIVKPNWLDLILSGKKRLEIRRGRSNKVARRIGLSASGSSTISATALFMDCHGPLSPSQWAALRPFHLVEGDDMPYGDQTCAWELDRVQVLAVPLPFCRRRGPVVWQTVVVPNSICSPCPDFRRGA